MDDKKLRLQCLQAAIDIKRCSSHAKADETDSQVKEKSVIELAKEFETFVLGEKK